MKSESLAGIVGPTLIVMVLAELKWWNPHLYDSQIVPLVYISGVLFFIAGISIVRNHNIWVIGWQAGLTIIGWSCVLLGLARMFFPAQYKQQFKNDLLIFSIETALIVFGLFLSYKAYWHLLKGR